MRPLFNATYARVNDSEATAGGTARHGFLDRDLPLRDAIKAAHDDTPAASEARGTWPDCSDPRATRYVSTESTEWETGDDVTYSIHFPANTTSASRARLCRLLANRL